MRMLREFTRLLFLPAPYAAASTMKVYRAMAGKDPAVWKLLLWGSKFKAGLFLLLSVVLALGTLSALLSGADDLGAEVVMGAATIYVHLLLALIFWLVASRIEKMKH